MQQADPPHPGVPKRRILQRALVAGTVVFMTGCSTVRVKEVPLLLTRESIASSRMLKSRAFRDAEELESFARSSLDLLKTARKQEQLGKIEAATVNYLRTAIDARALLVSTGGTESVEVRTHVLEIHNHSLARFAELWSTNPRRGEDGRVRFSTGGHVYEVTVPGNSDYEPPFFDRAVAADSLKGKGVLERVRDGYGAAMVGIRDQTEDRVDELRFYSRRGMHVPITLVLETPRTTGDTTLVPISIRNPMLTEKVLLGGRRVPLAANFSAPMEMLLEGRNDVLWGLKGFFEADERIKNSGIYLLEPYDPDRIPVILTHGLVSVPIIWRDLIPELMAQPELSKRYQFMVFTYPSSYILPESALLFRNELAELRRRYDPNGNDPLSRNMVAMGHSMGGMLTHLLVTEMGEYFWNELSDIPLGETELSPMEQERARELVYFDADPAVQRVVYLSAPHRGATAADLNLANAISRLATLPADALQIVADASPFTRLEESQFQYGKKITSVQSLSPESPIVRAMEKAPYKKGVLYHSIIGDRGKGDTPDSSDGIVEYWSSHQEGAASEIIVPTGHSSYKHPNATAEIKRILREHAGLR